MTSTELTVEEKRIKIAEALGWVKQTPENRQNQYGQDEWRKEGVRTPEGWDGHYEHDLPWYFHDLNAMHEAEKLLPEDKRGLYVEWLSGERTRSESGYIGYIERPGADFWGLAHPTAAQRAEAFGKTLNLW